MKETENESDPPPKKRPVSAGSNNIIEDSIHMNEVTGMTVAILINFHPKVTIGQLLQHW
jgi:hypothetical protein